MRKLVARFYAVPRDESGQTMAEYGVVLALVTLAVLGAMTMLGGSISSALQAVAGVFP